MFTDYISARDRIQIEFGKELTEKYEKIIALIALIDYRLNEAGEDYHYGLKRLFEYDSLSGKYKFLNIVKAILLPVLWLCTLLKYREKDAAPKKLLFSRNFVNSRRYPMAREQIEREYGCTSIVTICDTYKVANEGIFASIKSIFALSQGQYKPFFIFRYSISGMRLKHFVKKFYRYLLNVRYKGANQEKDHVNEILKKLQQAYLKRVKYLEKVFSKFQPDLYTTVNQYNLRDLLLIHAFKNLNVRTLQQEHHAAQFGKEFGKEQLEKKKQIYRLSFALEYALWSPTELVFHNIAYRYDNVLYQHRKNKFIISGDVEYTYEEAENMQMRYPEQNKLTFMTTALEATEADELKEIYTQYRWEIFNALKKLSESKKVTICIRYRPFCEYEYREKEIPILKKWGFEISESVPENLIEDICTSSVILSSFSSVLATARAFGKRIYRVKGFGIEYLQVDPEVNDIAISEIPQIEFPKDTQMPKEKMDKNMFYDIRRIVSD